MSVITPINLSLVFSPFGTRSILGGKVNVVPSYLLQAVLPTWNSVASPPWEGNVLCCSDKEDGKEVNPGRLGCLPPSSHTVPGYYESGK